MALDLIAIRRKLHEIPEVAFEEYNTSEYIIKVLAFLGLNPKRCAKTGAVVDVCGDNPGTTVALRVDIDALPIEEKNNLEYKSKISGKMHACGHDVHTAIAIGVAEALITRKSDIQGKVRIIFQPAEETFSGAKEIIKEGILKGTKAIYGLHNKPEMPVGQIALCKDAVMAASSKFKITVHGVGGHGAMPQKTKDPIVAAAAIISGLQTIASRNTDPLDPLVLSICRCTAGNTFNVIPDSVELEGTARYLSPLTQKGIPELLLNISNGIAQGYGCSAELEYEEMVPPLINNGGLSNILREVSIKLLGRDSLIEAKSTMTSEDFAVYQDHVPSCYFWLGSGGQYGFHHPQFNVDENCIYRGVEILSEVLIKTLESHS